MVVVTSDKSRGSNGQYPEASSSSSSSSSPSLSYSSSKNHFVRNRRPTSSLLTETNDDYETGDGGIDSGSYNTGQQDDNNNPISASYGQQTKTMSTIQRPLRQQSSLTVSSSQPQSSYMDQYDQRTASSQYEQSEQGPIDDGSDGYQQSPDESSQYQEQHYHHQQQPQYGYSEPSDSYYEEHHDGSYDEQPTLVKSKKPPTVGDLYYQRPTIESGYGDDSSYSPSDYGAAITSTGYKTGHYIREKGARYPKAYLSPKPSSSKTVIFTVPQPIPHDEKPKNFEIPSLDVAGLDKIIPGGGDLMKNSPVKIPALPGIDFNSIIGNLFGDKGPPQISVAAPESLGNLIAPLLNQGKPLTINAPNIEFGHGHGGPHHGDSDSKTKLVGFSVPDFLKNSQKFIQGFQMPKIDFTGEHESGLTLPHFDMPNTQSIGKSPKITAIAPMGPSIHFLRHLNLPLPKVPKMRLPELGPFRSFKIPKLDFTKSFDLKSMDFKLPSHRDGMSTMEDSPKPTYLPAPGMMMIKAIQTTTKPSESSTNNVDDGVDDNVITMDKPTTSLTMAKIKKIITAYPMNKGSVSGHIVIEDYPYGRKQLGPLDDGGESEIGCAELDKVIIQQQLDDHKQQQQQQQPKSQPKSTIALLLGLKRPIHNQH
nr:uncharacterized protein LOC124490286 [Dermatophagoides farinae]